MSERLKLAESYYAVAADLQNQGQWMLDVAKNLNSIADRLCEESMREKRDPDRAGVNDASKT